MAALEDLIKAVRHRDGNHSAGETLVPAAHISQMKQWMIRQGLRFFPQQDASNEVRRKLLEQVVSYNKLDLYYSGIVSTFLCCGSILWYLRPTGTSAYEIHWYGGGDADNPETEYKAYYKPGGRELQEVVIRYSYEDYSSNTAYGAFYGTQGNHRWVRLRITAEYIIEEKFFSQPTLYPEGYMAPTMPVSGTMGAFDRQITANSLGFIPCAESPNEPLRPGDSGNGDFNWLRNQIEAEDAMRASMVGNVFQFSSPSLITSRPATQIQEAIQESGDVSPMRPTWSSQQGFGTSSMGSSRRDDPWVRGNRYGDPLGGSGWAGRRSRVARIIGGVEPEERFGYIFPDPINGDQWRFAQEYREGLHECLGGIDPLGMKAGMTFGEVKSLYGKVAATATRKCLSLFTYGLCKILEMVIYVEEQVFLESYKNALLDPKISSNAKKYQKQIQETGQGPSPQEILQDFADNNMVFPPGVSGIPPFGDRTVKWVWTGPVFEKLSRDLLDDSIVVRNQQELGVGSLQALQSMFPDKDPRELKAMLTGVPFRFISSVSGSIGTMLQLQMQMMSVPDPMTGGKSPLGARLDLTPLIQQQIASLAKEISYGEVLQDADQFSDPTLSISPGLPGNNYPGSNNASPVGNAANGAANGATDPGSGTSAPVRPVPNYPVPDPVQSVYAAGFPISDPSQFPGIPTSAPGSGAGNPGFAGQEWQQPLPAPGGAILGYGSIFPNGNGSTPAAGIQQSGPGLPNIPPDLPASVASQLYPAIWQQLQQLQQQQQRSRGNRSSGNSGGSAKGRSSN
jgi:hypothetical protein